MTSCASCLDCRNRFSTGKGPHRHHRAMRWQRRLSTAFAAAGHPALRPHSPARLCRPTAWGHRTTDTVESTDGTDSVLSSPSVFQWCQETQRAFQRREWGTLIVLCAGNGVYLRLMRYGHPALRPRSRARTLQMSRPFAGFPIWRYN